MGAHNSVNIVNFRRFLSIFARYVVLYDIPVEVLIAGNMCEGITEDHPFARKLGFLDDSGEFYRMVDAVVIPLKFSTGIKIKVAEALAWNVPVLATRDAFEGFRAYHPTQHAPTLHALCEMIVAVAFRNPTPRDGMSFAEGGDRGGRSAGAGVRRTANVDRQIIRPRRAGVPGIAQLLEPAAKELGVDEVLERADSVSRDDAFRPLASHCADQICQTLGYPIGSLGLSQKIFQTNFDLHSQIKWINQQVVLAG